MKGVPSEALLKLVRGLLDYPFPQVCRHLVAHDVLTIMKESGVEIPDELLRAVTHAKDDEAKQILEPLIS